jgi:hypothetical protein
VVLLSYSPLIPGPINSGYGRGKIHHITDASSEHMQPCRELSSSLLRYYQLAVAVTESSKGHFTIILSQFFQGGREHGKTREFHKPGLSCDNSFSVT